jgi:hypothetical protein
VPGCVNGWSGPVSSRRQAEVVQDAAAAVRPLIPGDQRPEQGFVPAGSSSVSRPPLHLTSTRRRESTPEHGARSCCVAIVTTAAPPMLETEKKAPCSGPFR